ncbi:restriction endonuclease subunit S [Acidipropionibacterium acidipropionici]|uniref:restriction endonuclease subunit S n=1 Tax=Acidipropionibacterium acidipropionici TaxID=1748 RepID=UPI00040B014E|nr:restriction endonuclease subunit S [Acidipropionibacterium acidipropionici]ALN14358.1 hypothetical protein ASQ49_02705 [Acidipropionibacterium acidipropionici]APZ09880.1 hypothetical protein BWX38_12245 [Acidipropionibacterium acidipropionici]
MTRGQAEGNDSEDWTTVPLWRIAKIIVSTVDKKSYKDQVAVRLCNYVDVYYHDRIDDTINFMESTASLSEISSFSARAGDVVITKDSETAEDIGKSAIVGSDPEALVYGYHLTTYRPYDLRYSGFLKYIFDSAPFRARLINSCNGVTRVGLTGDTQRNIRVPIPAPPTAKAIADYLDTETAQIDASVDAQRRLITLLHERRVGVIGDLVTRGIGEHDLIETPELSWSQKSPRDWDLAPLSGIVRTRFSGAWGTDPGEDEIDVPCVRVADFDRERRVVSSDVPTIRSIPRSSWISKGLRKDDLLLERSGGTAKNPVGTVVRYSGSSGAICSNFIEVIRLREGQDPQYWNYALRFAYENGFTFKFVNQTTGIQNLDANGFYSAKFAVPPLTEQRQIVNALDAVTAKLDTLIVRSERLIELLQERRSAVITAAVTGQIDVTRSEEAA